MKKSNLKKAFALSALMAFVITGSAYADNVDVADGDKYDKTVITVDPGGSFKNAGTVIADESITVNGGTFNNTGNIQTGTLNIYGNTKDDYEITGNIKASDKIIFIVGRQMIFIHAVYWRNYTHQSCKL